MTQPTRELAYVEGLREVDDALAEIPQALRRPVVLSALRRAARPMVRDARLRAPRGTDPRRRGSEKQRRSGEAAAIGHGADSIRARSVRARSQHEATVAVGPDKKHWYMSLVEFGTSRHAPQRFLTPAFEAHKRQAIETFGDALWKSISRTAARLARKAAAGKLGKRAERALRE